jgi:hypothetical protein
MAIIYAGAGLRIMGEDIDLDAISRELNLTPSHVHRRGELDKSGDQYAHDMWLLDSPLGKHEQLDAHLKWLGKQLKPHSGYLKSVKNIARVDVFCSCTAVGEGGLSLTPDSLSVSTELGLNLELSLILLRSREET